ncbi:hypothetical protein LINPERHAP2_LOCUS17407 [Linum perenne]
MWMGLSLLVLVALAVWWFAITSGDYFLRQDGRKLTLKETRQRSLGWSQTDLFSLGMEAPLYQTFAICWLLCLRFSFLRSLVKLT